MEEQKIELGIHKNITPSMPKDSKETKSACAYYWVNRKVIWNSSIIPRLFQKHAIIPFTLKGEHKNKENIEYYTMVVLDWESKKTNFDDIKNLLEHENYTFYMASSVNHQKNTNKGISDRFHVFIPFRKDKNLSLEQYENLGKVLENKYKNNDIDETCFSPARYFYPSPSILSYFHDREEFFDPFDYISQEITPVQKVNKKKRKKSASKKEVFSKKDFVTLEDGTQKKISNIKSHTKIICTFCDPENRTSPDSHNSFLNINSKGVYYQRCSSEKLTRWQDPEEVDTTSWEVFWEDSLDQVVKVNDINSKRRKSVIKPMKSQEAWVKHCTENKMDIKSKMYLKRYSLVFDTTIPYGANPVAHEFNTYTESELIIYGREHPIEELVTLEYLKKNCPLISYILWNVLVDNETVEYFLNWIFYIIRKKRKVHTMWVISTGQGAGKNSISSLILKPLIGIRHFLEVPVQRLRPKFNSLEATVIFKVVNEVFTKGQHITNLRNQAYIKDDVSSGERILEYKGQDCIVVDNFLSYILFSNEGTLSWLLEKKDRRSNISINENSVDMRLEPWFIKLGNTRYENKIKSELNEFARYMMAFELDDYKANNPLENTDKLKMQLASKSREEDFYNYLKSEDWDKLGIMEYNFTETVRDNFNVPKNYPVVNSELLDTCESYHGIPQQFYSQLLKEWFGSRVREARKELTEKGVNLIDTTINSNRVKFYKVI